MKEFVTRIKKSDSFFGGMIAVVMFCVLAFFSPYFFKANNLLSLQAAIAPSAIIAIGMMILMIMGMLDMSVGSIMGLSGIVTGYVLSKGMGITMAIVAGLATGLVIGIANGMLVAYGKVIPLIATLGTMTIFRGVCEMVMSSDMATYLTGFPEAFLKFGSGKIFGLLPMVYLCLIIFVVFWFITRKTYFGRQIYYIGNSMENSRLMGINVEKMTIIAYAISGVLSALAGIVSVARFEAASRYLGQDMQMNILIACIIGGGSMNGGKGSVIGAMFGTIFIALLSNAFTLFMIKPQWQSVILGAVLLLVVAADGYLYIKKMRKLGKM